MKKLFLLLSIALLSTVAVSCGDDDRDSVETLAGTEWESIDEWTSGDISYLDSFTLSFLPSNTVTIIYFRSRNGNEVTKEVSNGTYTFIPDKNELTITHKQEEVSGIIYKNKVILGDREYTRIK